MTSTRRLRALRRTIAGTVLAAGLAVGGTAGAPSASALVAHPTDMTVLEATYTVLGFLWADGHGGAQPGDWRYASRTQVLVDQFTVAARTLGATVETGYAAGKYTANAAGLTLDVNQDGLPPLLVDPESYEVKYFLAPVLESEGNKTSGLVLDDPLWSRVAAVQTLMSSLGVATTVTGTTYFRVYADPAGWPVFQTLPCLIWSRVPGAPAKR